jgi:hypothetical protein
MADLARIKQIESGGDPYARTGSYHGLYQLSVPEFEKYGGGDIYNAEDNERAATRKFEAEEARFRNKYGRSPTSTEVYMTHQQGEGGFNAHYSNPDGLAWQNMAGTLEGRQKGAGWARQAICGNVPDDVKAQFPGGVDSLTSKQFMDLWGRKVEGGGGPMRSAFAQEGRRNMTPMQMAMGGGSEDEQIPLNAAYAQGTGYAPEPSLGAKFLAGGPGALFGVPGRPLFDGMMLAGMALRDDSKGLVPMTALLKQEKEIEFAREQARNSPKDKWSLTVGPDGEIIKFRNSDGAHSIQRGLGRKLDPSVLKEQAEGLEKSTTLHSVSQEARQYSDKIAKGELDLSLMSKGQAAWENLFGATSPKAQEYNAFQSFRTGAANSILQAAKGTQTEGDAQRAYNEFTQGLAQHDNATTARALEKLIAVNGRLIAARKTSLDATSDAYRDNPALERYRKAYDDMGPMYAPRPQAPAGAPSSAGAPAASAAPVQPAYKVLKVH